MRDILPIAEQRTLQGYRVMWMLCRVLLIAAMPLLLTGCNAVKGFGKDIHDATQNVQEWIEGGEKNSRHIRPS